MGDATRYHNLQDVSRFRSRNDRLHMNVFGRGLSFLEHPIFLIAPYVAPAF